MILGHRKSIPPIPRWADGGMSGFRLEPSDIDLQELFLTNLPRPKRNLMSLEESTISNMWQIAALVGI
jgi:hypothetical protein